MSGPASSQTPEKPPLDVEMTWTGDLKFLGRAGEIELPLDSNSQAGVSPMQALALAVTGCMAMDLVHILSKSRVPPSALRARLSGRRPANPPSRFTAIALHFDIEGNAPEDQVDRAIQLSRDKYCSVWNSMRQDIDLQVTYTISPYQPAEPTPQD